NGLAELRHQDIHHLIRSQLMSLSTTCFCLYFSGASAGGNARGNTRTAAHKRRHPPVVGVRIHCRRIDGHGWASAKGACQPSKLFTAAAAPIEEFGEAFCPCTQIIHTRDTAWGKRAEVMDFAREHPQ